MSITSPPFSLIQVLKLLVPSFIRITRAPFDKWLERKPSLGQRRDACLAIVVQCIEEKAAPTVIELSAKAENLRFTEHGVGLQLLPDWGAWRRTAAADTATVQAVAALCAELLTGGFSKVQEHLYPVELQLIFARLNSGSYQEWSQLQRDLADIPDDLLPIAHTQRTVFRRAGSRTRAACGRADAVFRPRGECAPHRRSNLSFRR